MKTSNNSQQIERSASFNFVTARIAIFFLACFLLVTNTQAAFLPGQAPEGENSQTVTLQSAQVLSASAYVTFEDLSPALRASWSFEIESGSTTFHVTAMINGSFPADTEMAIATVTDPETGHEQSYLVGTDGGAIVILISDL